MPPANSRATSPPAAHQDPGPRAATPPSYLSALRELERPVNRHVLNLAATLMARGDDEGRAERAERTERTERARERLRNLQQRQDDVDQRDRLRRVMNRLSRIHDTPAYGDRVPNQNSLYDWSPANEADDEDELDQILAELRREQPNTHPEVLRVLGRSQLDSERESRVRAHSSNQPSQPADGSLRSAALLRSVRRHPRFSAHSRDSMQRYNATRDAATRPTHESRDGHSSTEIARQAAIQQLANQRSSQSLERDRERDMLARVEPIRRSYLDRTSPPVSGVLEHTIRYLSRIRYSNTRIDSLNCAMDANFLSSDFFTEDSSDFVLDTSTLPPPAESSWLAPGAVLSGCQHATSVTSTVTTAASGASTTLYRFRNSEAMSSTVFDPSRPWLSHQAYESPSRRSLHSSGPEVVTSHTPQQDRWPVKVTIHAVDYTKMSLAATMEAYNVPSHPHTHQSVLSNAIDGNTHPFTRTSSITTYLEGEILDFNHHTLLTESFKSSSSTDATYWSKLPPFQNFTDEELKKRLTSKRWLTEELNRDWILMRWKERCFVKSLNRSTGDPVQAVSFQTANPRLSSRDTAHDSFISTTSSRENYPSYHWAAGAQQEEGQFDDSGCGLTISGFYYVCLRRSDGKLEGLYYDPQSSPYQCLKLDSVNGGMFPAWQFR
ncbi:hypothetical protein EJ04DRAFT_573545 [Polyplosphaeria fusca]|uniref:Vacuolar import and degradation protein-domain-containing protein n=1 Tax=Polyplosphaeria fusca TaxID=682080 RepID=A0A9P4V7Q7_9PLEO|nr:hypothetical protein EJ04DRAFT_573545 [Polyplosphaeria fusca]